MAGQALPEGTRELLLFLGTAGIAVPLFSRLRVSPVLGFLIAGVALGPFGLGALASAVPALSLLAITEAHRLEGIGELGVVFLLFMVGLELSFERLSRLRRLVFGFGALQLAGSAALVALPAALLGLPPAGAIVLGLALALSSTAVTVPVLAERKHLNSTAGRTVFSVLLFQDLAVAPLLFTITALSTPRGGGLGVELLVTLGPAVLALGFIVLLGRLVLRPLFHVVAATRSTEFFMAACLLVVIGTGAVAVAGGLSMSLGAFLAGLLLAETEFRREIEVTIEPFKGLLLGLFFVTIGVGLDLGAVLARPDLVLLLGLGVVAVKALLVYAAGRLFRLPRGVSAEVALLLGPSGEFAFVLVGQAAAAGLLPASLAHITTVSVTLTMMLIPALARFGERLGRRPAAPQLPAEPPPEDGEARVIIVGYGRVGRLVGEMVALHGLPFIAVDGDARLVRRERDAGVPVYYGDATRHDFLARCGLDTARGLVLTLNDPRVAEEVVTAARAARADLTIVARARDAEQARRLYDLGATDAVPETIEASLQLSEAALVDMGVPAGLVIASVHEKRDAFRKLLNEKQPDGRERRAIRRAVRRG
ncbi:cation:proton antiporter [Lichenibacterium ramalinae]|uniref:Potassium transporter TrkA n=1 Tax=Lichenibacterium ramalinae TaxID=2316527 RepID=A0A4Q2RG16_9HYPH|nr:cation:proton antiporter [Lichenibacterium ramalinae]RYB06397.1 potassium transporter TrkA [Lichenibacterium ramalinae]